MFVISLLGDQENLITKKVSSSHEAEDGLTVANVGGGRGVDEHGLLLVLEGVNNLGGGTEDGHAHVLVSVVVADDFGGVGVFFEFKVHPVSLHDGFTMDREVVIGGRAFVVLVVLVIEHGVEANLSLDDIRKLYSFREGLVFLLIELDVDAAVGEDGLCGGADEALVEVEVTEDTGGDGADEGDEEEDGKEEGKVFHFMFYYYKRNTKGGLVFLIGLFF